MISLVFATVDIRLIKTGLTSESTSGFNQKTITPRVIRMLVAVLYDLTSTKNCDVILSLAICLCEALRKTSESLIFDTDSS